MAEGPRIGQSSDIVSNIGVKSKIERSLVKPTLESGLTLVSANSSLSMTLTNGNANSPSAVELTFPTSALKAQSFDDGTDVAPTFAIEPGSSRVITLIRGSGSTPGGSTVTEVINAKLADGTKISQSVTVEAEAGTFADAVADLGAPTIELRMDAVDGSGKIVATGSVSIGNASPLGGGWVGPVTSATTGFTHYFEQTALTDYLQVYAPTSAYCRNTDRSWIFVWEHDPATAVSSRTLSESNTSSGTDSGWGKIGIKSGLYQSQANATLAFSAANGTHSSGGTAEALTTAAGKLCLLVISYDAGTPPGSLIFRWKQTQSAYVAGHTYATQATTLETSSGSNTLNIAGDDSSFSGHPVRWRYFGIIDSTVNTAEFDTLATAAGL